MRTVASEPVPTVKVDDQVVARLDRFVGEQRKNSRILGRSADKRQKRDIETRIQTASAAREWVSSTAGEPLRLFSIVDQMRQSAAECDTRARRVWARDRKSLRVMAQTTRRIALVIESELGKVCAPAPGIRSAQDAGRRAS